MRRAKLPLALVLLGFWMLLPGGARSASGAEDWSRKLGKNDPDAVYATILEITRRRDASAGLALIEAGAKTPYSHLAVACGEALSDMDADAVKKEVLKHKKFNKRFAKLMGSKEPAVQKNLARILGAWGHPFVDKHLAHLASGRRSPDVQEEALYMCGALQRTKKRPFRASMEAVGKALGGRTEEIRVAACSAAGRLKVPTFVPQLESVVRRDQGKYTGLYAVWALKQIGWRGGLGPFLHVLKQGPKKTTMQANLKAVTELCRPQDFEALMALSKNGKKDYRDAAILALGRLAWRSLRRAQQGHQNSSESGAVTPGVAPKPGKPAPGKLPEPPLHIGGEIIDRMIRAVREERSWEVRDAARQALLRFGARAQAKVREAMPSIVESGDNDASQTAMELCGHFGATDAYSSLLKVALYDKEPTRRMFAARALEGMDVGQVLADITKGIRPRKKAKGHELNAVRALGYVRDKRVFDYLVKLVYEDGYGEDLLRECEFALERITGHRFGRKPERWKAWFETAENPFHPRVKKFDRKKNRRDAVDRKLFGLTPVTERAVENGLRWMEQHQHSMGNWDGNDSGFNGIIGCEPAYTGLAVLSFVGAGYNSAEGKYSETIRRATDFLAASQYYDGGFPVTGGGDSSWIFAYLIGMGIWGVTESYGLSGDEMYAEPSQWGVDYLVRTQTPGGGWRYGARATESDTSCTSWVLMTTKMADLIGLDVAQRSWDGIDSWLERASYDITGHEEVPDDLATDYDYEVGSRRKYKAFTGYFELKDVDTHALRSIPMTAVGMVCRFFMGWKRSHPYMIGCANYLMDYLPQWMKGMDGPGASRWYHYYWYYGTLAMHQMGGRYWRAWNQKIKGMLPENQVLSPPRMAGSWTPDSVRFGGGRLLSTPLAIMTLETYYRFSPLMDREEKDEKKDK